MANDYFSYWGKAQPDQAAPYHLLPWHSLDVAAVAWQLLAPEKPLSRDLAEYLALDGQSLRQLFTALAAIHDLGKFSSAFQALYALRGQSPKLSQQNSKKEYNANKARHDTLGWAFVQAGFGEGFWGLPECPDHQWDTGVEQLFGIVLGHHGLAGVPVWLVFQIITVEV